MDKVRVRLLKDCYDGRAGDILALHQHQAFRWVETELAEFVEPAEREKRARPAPRNTAKKAPQNRAKKPTETEE
ncbi:MAG TPA: hypothetical protein VMX15_00965 [Candidatus Heimdallarchaeota archaeon]|nr:hypothetical protein [Candidatus Heimdallarchaeota archaeon]